MGIVLVRVRSVGVDVSITVGILMFIWGKPKAEALCFLLVPAADISIPKRIMRFLCADVIVAQGILMFI